MQSKTEPSFIIGFFVVCFAIHSSHVCTTFSIKKGNTLYYGKNTERHVKDGLVAVNNRYVKKIHLKHEVKS